MDESELPTTTVTVTGGCETTPSDGSQRFDEDVTKILTEYFRPLHEEYLDEVGVMGFYAPDEFKIDPNLMLSVFYFTWGPDVFKTPKPLLRRLHKELAQKLTAGPSDENDLKQHFYIDAMSARLNQLALSIALVDVTAVKKEITLLETLINDDRIYKNEVTNDAAQFVLSALKGLFTTLTSVHASWAAGPKYPDFNELPSVAANCVNGLSILFIKMFRVKSPERCDMMRKIYQNDTGNFEWILYLSEMLRMKRRRALLGKSKPPSEEELNLVAKSIMMEPDNPFVRLNLIHSVVDAIQNANGEYKCGDSIKLKDPDDAMKWLKKNCKDLAKKFRSNVYINSVMSDIFVRLLPVKYFDKKFTKKLLKTAYNLNPNNPETSHKYGTLYRMTEQKTKKSLEFFEKALKLDLSFYHANLDFFNTLLAKPKKYNEVVSRMTERLESEESSGWRPIEIAEFRFLLGIACFAAGNTEEAFHQWKDVMKQSEFHFVFNNVEEDCTFFCWDSKVIGAAKLRRWIQKESEAMTRLEVNGDPAFDCEKKEILDRMFQLLSGARPKCPNFAPYPYSGTFEYRIEQRVLDAMNSMKKT